MAFDEYLAERVSNQLKERKVNYTSKKMFGGIYFLVNDKMCLGVQKDDLMARIDHNFYHEALKINGAKEMNFTGRPMKGFVFVSPEGLDMESDLSKWIDLCLSFNPMAKSSKKK